MAKKIGGRKRGGHNRGYFYRKGRGWYVSEGSKQLPLRDQDGHHIKDEKANGDLLRDAYARWRTNRGEEIRVAKSKMTSQTVYDICKAYLYNVQVNGSQKTLTDRMDTLFDLCSGLAPEYRQEKTFDPKKLTKEEQRIAKRFHKGYGTLSALSFSFTHLNQWIASHENWGGGIRARVQAVKRAFNYAVESGMLQRNPIRGYKVKKPNARVTYITPEQENALLEKASVALATAIRVCIRTGARPGVEFCKLTAKHIRDHGDRMEWVFQKHESKTGKLRILRIIDPDILKITREAMKAAPAGDPIFRTHNGQPWNRQNLSQRFRFLKRRVEQEFDDDCCIYSCRHTYAKRTLEGYWTGKACNIETLARLMGNSPQVCRDHYLQFSTVDNEFLWDNA